MIASFQWDLNYSNPEVFLAMVEEMLFIANLGVDVLRLDALAFVWKEKGTVCESLPKAHTLIQAFQYVASIACPSLQFKSDWKKKSEYKSQEMVADFVKKVIALRKEEPMLGGSEIFFYDIQDSHVFAFRRGTIHVVANFSDSPAEFMIDAWSENSRDLLSGRNFWNHQKHLLSPYEVRWLKEIIE